MLQHEQAATSDCGTVYIATSDFCGFKRWWPLNDEFGYISLK